MWLLFVWNTVGSFHVLFFSIKKTFLFELFIAYSNWVKYTIVGKLRHLSFILPDFSNIQKLFVFSFYGNILTCISSIGSVFFCNRTRWKHWLFYQGFDWNDSFSAMTRLVWRAEVAFIASGLGKWLAWFLVNIVPLQGCWPCSK